MEVGTKMLNDDKKDEAKDLFEKALTLWNIFWGLNLNLLDVKDVALNDEDKKVSVFETLNKIIKKILDCCKE
jgi:hypothetical protein